MKKLVLVIAAMAMFATTAIAADWAFYGSARVDMSWTDTETIGSTTEVDDFTQGLFGNSRIGANVKVSDEISGRFEYGSGPNLRLLYGTWNFGAGSLRIGQDYSPMDIGLGISSSHYGGDLNHLNKGGIYSGRLPQVKLIFGDFQIAFVSESAVSNITGTTENKIPKIEARYTLKMDPVTLKVAGGYNTFEVMNAGTTYDVDSYVVGAAATVNFGMLFVKADMWIGQNPANIIVIDVDSTVTTDGRAGNSGTQVLDNDGFGYLAVIGAKINDMFTIEAGYAYAETDLDLAAAEDEVNCYYANATITLTPGVFLVPEIGVVDYEETGQAKVTYGALKWQINF